MNVWHIYARYYNFGDYALGVGVRNLFSRCWPDNLIFKLFDTHDFTLDRAAVRKANETADLVLVGGGGLIHEFGGKWLFRMPDNLISRLKVPMIFFGLGYNLFPGQPDIGESTIRNIRLLWERAVSFSVRNDGSKERLGALGIEVPEVPDPGFFVDGDYARPDVDGPYVAVQVAGDMKQHRGFNEDALAAGMVRTIEFLLERGFKVLLTPHVRADIALSSRLMDTVRKPGRVLMWDLFSMLRDEHTLGGLAYYKHAHLVLAMRGHAQICPIGMNTPVITIASHEKNVGLFRHLDVDPFLVEADDPTLGDKLVDLILEMERSRDRVLSRYAEALSRMKNSVEEFVGNLRAGVDEFRARENSLKEERERSSVSKLKRLCRRALRKRFRR